MVGTQNSPLTSPTGMLGDASSRSRVDLATSPDGPNAGGLTRGDSTVALVTDGLVAQAGASLTAPPQQAAPAVLAHLRVAALLFATRNFLDTLDGVVARLNRRRHNITGGSTNFGFNGHSLDVVTDLFGCACVGVAIFMFLLNRSVFVSRVPSLFLSKLNLQVHRQRPAFAMKVVAVGGLLLLAATGGIWETFMLRYSNLFDVHAPSTRAIFALEDHWQVRANQFLWSFTCGDALLFYLIVALLANKLWGAIQLFFFVGYPWLALVAVHSFYVWNFVVLKNADAAAIVARTPENFL
jgi:hypothetical protein